MKTIDLRSDTVTRPTPEMRKAMAAAEVGDDVYGEDPTINRLEALAAEITGKEAGLFASSGTQSNLAGVLCHCGRGDEYIVGQQAHTYKYEGGGAAVLGSIQPQPLDFETDGTLDLGKVEAAIKPDNYHFARTRLLCIENTQAGKALPVEYIPKAVAFAREKGLKTHLDGARLFNAAVKCGRSAAELAFGFDTVSICLSKGLGAPVGSVLCGGAEDILEARKWRKMLGGGMRQAGIIAAAGIFALENNIKRLAEDHYHAGLLAEGLAGIEELRVLPGSAETNMVFIELAPGKNNSFEAYLSERGIIVEGRGSFRLVAHLDIDESDIKRTIDTIKSFFST